MKLLNNKGIFLYLLMCATFLSAANSFCSEHAAHKERVKDSASEKTESRMQKMMINLKKMSTKKKIAISIGLTAGTVATYVLCKKTPFLPLLFLTKKTEENEKEYFDANSAKKLSKGFFIYGLEGIFKAAGTAYILTNETVRKKIDGLVVKEGIRGLPVYLLKKSMHHGWTIVGIEAVGGIAKIAAGVAMNYYPQESAALLNKANRAFQKAEDRFGPEDKLEALGSF